MGRYLPAMVFVTVMALLLIALGGAPNAGSPGGGLPGDGLPGDDLAGSAAPPLSVMPLDPEVPVPDIARVAADGPILINFFASWCAPCQAEHDQLRALQRRGITLLGVAWHDNGPMLRDWLRRHDNPYAFVGLDTRGETAVAYGATGVPESYLVDPAGRILLHIPGPLTPAIVEREVMPRLRPVR